MLKPALGQGLLMENKNQLQFIHDKVQEAALSAIPGGTAPPDPLAGRQPPPRPRFRRARTSRSSRTCSPSSPTSIWGGKSDRMPRTAYLLSDLNYHAGNKALDSLATEAANEYFSLSRELLPDDCWEDSHYERTFRIFQKAAKTELMCGNYGESERLLDRAARPCQDRPGQGGMPGRTDDLAVIHRQLHQGHRDGQPGSGLFRQGHPGGPGGGRSAEGRS